MHQHPAMLYSLTHAAEELGGVSVWTLRRHAALGTLAVTRIGRRVLVTAAELSRVQREGLPPLRPGLAREGSANTVAQ